VLGLLFFFLILAFTTLVIKTRDTNCVVVLVVDLVSHLIEKRNSLGLSDRLREGKG
jgi:Mg2+/citrate symporter